MLKEGSLHLPGTHNSCEGASLPVRHSRCEENSLGPNPHRTLILTRFFCGQWVCLWCVCDVCVVCVWCVCGVCVVCVVCGGWWGGGGDQEPSPSVVCIIGYVAMFVTTSMYSSEST